MGNMAATKPLEKPLRHPPPAGGLRVQQPTASPGAVPCACCSAYSPSSPVHSPARPGHDRCTAVKDQNNASGQQCNRSGFVLGANVVLKGYWAINTGHSWLFGM